MARKKKEEPRTVDFDELFVDGGEVTDVYPDTIYTPAHYTSNKWDCWDVLDEFFPAKPLLWQVGKYLLRAGKKGDYLEDLLKSRRYLDREIDQELKRRESK